MLKLGGAYLVKLCVKLAKNAVIRGGREAIGGAIGIPLPSMALDGVISLTDDIVDRCFRPLLAQRTPAQRRAEVEDLANMTPAELAHTVAEAVKEDAAEDAPGVTTTTPIESPYIAERAMEIASRIRRNAQEQSTVPNADGRSILKPAFQLNSAADLAELLKPVRGGSALSRGDDVMDGRYKIVRFLASGGMGAVYLALDTMLDEQVVLKTILPALTARAESRKLAINECKLARQLSHPHIVKVYDAMIDKARDLFFITMQHLDGLTLGAWLDSRKKADGVGGGGGVSLDEFRCLADALCSALDHAHHPVRGVLHLDLKPSNIMVTPDLSSIWVLDFGLGKARSPEQSLVSNQGGTAYYMAPEQRLGERVDARADIYSLGVVFFQLLTGDLPAGSETVADDRPTLPPAISEAIAKSMRRKPEQRFASVAEFRAALHATKVATPVSAAAPSPTIIVPPRLAVSAALAAPASGLKALTTLDLSSTVAAGVAGAVAVVAADAAAEYAGLDWRAGLSAKDQRDWDSWISANGEAGLILVARGWNWDGVELEGCRIWRNEVLRKRTISMKIWVRKMEARAAVYAAK